jgi:hypothetical protein
MAYTRTYSRDPFFISAKFRSLCSETGRTINKGDRCLYFPLAKKVFHPDSDTARDFGSRMFDETMHELAVGHLYR